MKLEQITLGGCRAFRLTEHGGTVRTRSATDTLAVLHQEAEHEHAHRQHLQHAADQASEQVRACISRGDDATDARAALTRIQANQDAATEQASDLKTMVAEVRAAAVQDYAKPLRQQHAAAIAAAIATLPPIPTLENHHAD